MQLYAVGELRFFSSGTYGNVPRQQCTEAISPVRGSVSLTPHPSATSFPW